MERLSARTVFHEISMQQRTPDDDDDNSSESGDSAQHPGTRRGSKQTSTPAVLDSDEEWDTDLETEGIL
jgi:hypothetical protein